MKNICAIDQPSTPGLLPWQSYLLAFVLGVISMRHPLFGAVSLGVLYLTDRCLRGPSCRLPLLAFICCAVFGLGDGWQRMPESVSTLPTWIEERVPVVAHGMVDRVEPRSDDRQRVILRDVICEVQGQIEPLPGKVTWYRRAVHDTPAPGQTVTAMLRIAPVHNFKNPGTWDFELYWQRQGVFWRAWRGGKARPVFGDRPESLLSDAKQHLRMAVSGVLPDTQGGAMVLALTTGDRSRLTKETMDVTRSAGLAHTLALSGLHVGFVAAVGLGLAYALGLIWPGLFLRWSRPRLAVVLAAPLVLGYAWLGQPSASLIRASLMFGFWGVLLLQGRGRALLDGLFFALMVIVFWSPLSVFDLSLQLSLAAVAGIALLYPHFAHLFISQDSLLQKLLRWGAGVMCVSLSANIGILPLATWYFGVSTPNIFFNLIWLPVLGVAVMPMGLIGMLLVNLSWTASLGALLLGWAAWIMNGLLQLVQWAGQVGLTPVVAVLRAEWPEVLGAVLLLVAVAAGVGKGRRMRPSVVALGFVLLVGPHIWGMALDSRDEVRLTMLDVGLGQSLVVSLPGGHRWLIDGGGGSKHFDLGEAVVAPSLTLGRPPRLDGVVMSHPDSDHSHGLSVILARFDVGAFHTNGMLPRGKNGHRMQRALAKSGLVPVVHAAGDRIELGESAFFSVLHPQADFSSHRANERSLVLRLVRDGKGLAVLPGDVETLGLDWVLAQGGPLKSDILLLPHHGSKSSLSPAFYEAVSPRFVLASNGFLNRYGFPHLQVVEAVGGKVFTTSVEGMVECVWSGDNYIKIITPTIKMGLATPSLLR